MHQYRLDISENSVWNTATPTTAACTFPFYITEAGIFYARRHYFTTRSDNDSFMLLYTLSGSGIMKTENSVMQLSPQSAVMIDCRKFHSYHSNDDQWNFLWMHINGDAVPKLFEMLYPSEVHAVFVSNAHEFEELMQSLIYEINSNDILSAARISLGVHNIFNCLIHSDLKSVERTQKGNHSDDIDRVISFIKNNYSSMITIDDMLKDIHISKYHFIRLFKRVMGVTPYSYLMNYRINRSKILLRTTKYSIADIAAQCGFADTSNFIVQFKKHTGQKPTHYRHNFS